MPRQTMSVDLRNHNYSEDDEHIDDGDDGIKHPCVHRRCGDDYSDESHCWRVRVLLQGVHRDVSREGSHRVGDGDREAEDHTHEACEVVGRLVLAQGRGRWRDTPQGRGRWRDTPQGRGCWRSVKDD